MNKKITWGAALAYMAIVAAVAFSLTMIYSMNLFNVKMTSITEREKMYSSLHEVDLAVRESYYGVIDEDSLQKSIAEGYIAGIGDPNARYFTAEEYELYSANSSGKYIGVGIVPELDSAGYISVKEVYPNSPAQMAEIESGALITSVDGVRVTSANYEKQSAKLRGDVGSSVSLAVRQNNEDSNIELTYRVIDVPTVKYVLNSNSIAYIRFTEINNTTADQLESALTSLIAEGAKSAILDIRCLSSEELTYTTNILDILLPSGVLAYSSDKDGNLSVLVNSDSDYIDIPLVVIADDTTSGTAELFAMALQDFGRAKIIGTTTAGDGDVCSSIKLSDGSAIRVTTAQYAGPAKNTFGTTGVSPDYEVELGLASDVDRTSIFGNIELDVPYKKALEVAVASAK